MQASVRYSSNSTAARRQRKGTYGNACHSCRQKKRSCDGARPRCAACAASNDECIIPPPGRYLRQSMGSGSTARSPQSPPATVQDSIARLSEYTHELEERLRRMEEGFWRQQEGSSLSGESAVNASPRGESHQDGEYAIESTVSDWDRRPTEQVATDEQAGAKYRLTVDEIGNVTYYGMTGWNQGPDVPVTSPGSSSTRGNISNAPLAIPLPSLAESISQNQALTPLFQTLATSKHISVAPELGDALLNAYHCYQVLELTDQPSFLRDMVLGGPNYSELLLMIIYASASRMIDGLTEEQKLAQGDLFVKLAKAYLVKELEGPSKISTIQALLLLSSRECALGQISQGWNHAGLAFRMIQDLGIHHAPESLLGASNLSPEEQAIRGRLFWAAFIWDKILSLALGREPTFPPRPGRDPLQDVPGFTDDDEPWIPYFTHPLNCPPSLQGYVYPHARRHTTFRLLARLSLIVHDIIMRLYSSESRGNTTRIRTTFVSDTNQRLDELWRDVPIDMIPTPQSPSPPPHIFMFLIFFHASYILLHRPTVKASDVAEASGPAVICLQHSIDATYLAVRFSQTFGAHLRYLPRYCWFVAASFDVMLLECEISSVQESALERLDTWLRIMEKNLLRAPSIRRSFQQILALVNKALAGNPLLAHSVAGQSVKAFLLEQPGLQVPSPGTSWNENEAFEFLDLLQSS
ncbi:fungal-specific transcription factor domain-domain-containing protein [Naematelia encephala]|uniref:Fungal-specific transcription factor domain-domain-containing protein n=1 Tax=Naematelia encephala TaxID=71784 RepID=A0A1Y2B7U7_9TREE|nr:fungal-specific transcription factor domain-domain-containing protein [Naematelia encephala]